MPHNRSLAEQQDLKQRIVSIVVDVVWRFAGNNLEEEASSAWRSQLAGLVTHSILVREPTSLKCYDVHIKIATTLFHRFGSKTEKELILVSDYGVARHYSSVHELSTALLPDIECQCRGFSHHVRVDPKTAYICILTQFYERPLEFSCPRCPFITATAKQLRWHLHHNHATAYKSATSNVEHQTTRDTMAIVVYNPLGERKSDNVVRSSGAAPSSMATPAYQEAHDDSPGPTASLNDNDSSDPFTVIRLGGSLSQVKRALGDRDPTSLRDPNGALVLHWAAGLGRIDLLEYLIASFLPDESLAAPQVHVRYNGRTSLHWAARNGHVATVQWILERNSSVVDAVTADGTTPFGWAAWQGHQDVLEVLFKHGCNVRQMNQFGCNAALWAAQGVAEVSTMEWLHAMGCNVFLVNHAGHGVLHKSAQRGRWRVCRWFVELLAGQRQSNHSLDMIRRAVGPDNKGASPSDLAAMEGHMELAKYVERQEEILLGLTTAGTLGPSNSNREMALKCQEQAES